MATDPGDQDFRDSVLAEDVVRAPSDYVREQRQSVEDRLEAAEILEGLRSLDAGGDSVRWSISRAGDPDPSRNGHLVTWATSQLEPDHFRDALGGGKYYVKGRRRNGDYAGHTVINIASDAPRREGAALNVRPVTAVEGPGGMTEFLSAQERRDRERQEREDRRSAETKQLLLAALPAAATVFAAMFSRPQIDMAGLAAALKPAPAADPLIAIAALKQLMPSAPSGPSPMEQSLQLVELLLDRAGDQGKTGVLDVVKEGVKILGPTVGGAIEATLMQARANAQAAQQAPAPVGTVQQSEQVALPAPPATPVGDSSMLDLLPHLPWLREQLGRCASAAQKNRDPQLYAAMFLEELPEKLSLERVVQLVQDPQWLGKLAHFDARIAQQVPWWEAMRSELLTYIQEQLQPEPPARRKTGEIERPTVPPSITGE